MRSLFALSFVVVFGFADVKGADVIVDGGDTRVVTSNDYVSGGTYYIGSTKGVGKVTTLRVEEGGRLYGGYSTLMVGCAAGATGVVHLAGGELPAIPSKTEVSQISYLHIGEYGTGIFTNDHGKVYLRECCLLGDKPGSCGRYVHIDGEFGFCFGGKPFAVGVLGQGVVDVASGQMNTQDLLVGGTNTVDNVLTIGEGASVLATSCVSVGGYTNRMNRKCLEYPNGRGRIALRGGTLTLGSSSAEIYSPVLRIGPYPTSRGEIRGWGKLASSTVVSHAYLGFGHGAIVADGDGRERALDFTLAQGVTNFFGAADVKWAATNSGALYLPKGQVYLARNATGNCFMGVSGNSSLPDIPGSVRIRVSTQDEATHTFCGGLYALDRSDIHVSSGLPTSLGVVAVWKLTDSTSTENFTEHPLSFKSAVVTFSYDPASLLHDDSRLVLCRYENGAWKKLITTPQNESHTIDSPTLSPLADDEFNLGEFALLEIEPFHGNVAGTIPPGSDGWTEIGNPNYLKNSVDQSTTSESSSKFFENMAVPDWRNIVLSSPKKVRFVGGTLLMHELPSDAVYDFSQIVSLVTVTNRIFADGTPVAVPANSNYRFMPSVIEQDATTGKLSRTLDTRTGMNRLQDNLILNGKMTVSDVSGSIVVDGDFSGTGTVSLFNFYRTLTLTGNVDFDGEFILGQVQNNVLISPMSARSAHVGKVKACGAELKWSQTTELVWTPSGDGDTLSIDTLAASGETGWDSSRNLRYGNLLRIKGNGAVRVGDLTTSGSGTTRGLHLVAQGLTSPADVSFDRITSASRVYLHDRVNLTIGSVAAASVFDCSALGTSTNGASLRFTGSHPSTCCLLAPTPCQLPFEIIGYTGIVEIASSDYDLPVDLTRCYSIPKGAVIPETGAITVSLSSEMPAAGRYTILSWSQGCVLADSSAWTVALAGRAALCSLERTETGLDLIVPESARDVTFYVDSDSGDDSALGISPETAWRTLSRVNRADIKPGEKVLFRRGGLWRGQLTPKSGRIGAPVYYGAYGEGEKPILQQSAAAEAPGSWVKVSSGVWRTTTAYPIATYRDIGNIIFNHGEAYGWKRWALDKLVNERDYWYDRNAGHVYLKSRFDPSTQWESIELSIDQHVITEGGCKYVTYDGLAIRYGSAHGIGGGSVVGITVMNCDIYWIGGGVLSTSVNANGVVSYTRYGNGIEFWDGSRDCLVVSNRLWEIYDAAMTDQSDSGDHTNVTWSWNTVWNAEYSYEHFNRKKDYRVSDITVEHNTFVNSGGAWSHEQRPDPNGAALMIWYSSGPVTNFTIRNNIFVGSTQQGIRQTTDWHKFVSFSNNLFCMDGTPVVRMVNEFYDFDGFKSLGWDQNSIYADPMFADAAARDYRLLSGSPALSLGSDGLPAGACLERVDRRVFYSPSGEASAQDKFGRYVYSSLNWKTASGDETQPQTGDVLVVNSSLGLTANPASKAVPLGGILFNAFPCVSQGTLWMRGGGLGITNSCNGSTVWYAALGLFGSEDFPFYVGANATYNFQRYIEQLDDGAATVVKRGPGTLAFQDGSNYSPGNRATWKGTRLEAGTIHWSPTGAGGKAYDIQTFPINHRLEFADDGTCEKGAVFSLGKRDCTWQNIDLAESTTGRRKHVITTANATNVNIRLTGSPKTNPLCFSGAFEGRAGVWWNPDDATGELRLTRSVSMTQGDLRISRGTVRVTEGATFRALNSISLEAGSTLVVESSSGEGFFAAQAVLAKTASLKVGNGVVLSFGSVSRDGEAVAAATYTSSNCDWIGGEGVVVVGEKKETQALWDVASGETVVVSNTMPSVGAAKLYKTGKGILRLEGAKTFVCDMVVSNGTVVASGDESLGEPPGTTTFELFSSSQKGVLKIVCPEGTNVVSFHRPITFHYANDGSFGPFLEFPENATVNFYALMSTSIASPHTGPGYPNHWNFTCPGSTTVNWHGGMKASLNHEFSGGTHYIHKALTGGDRFCVYGGAKVVFLSPGNSIGGATGYLSGGAEVKTAVAYALGDYADSRSQTLLFSGLSTLDLMGNDQALAVLSSLNGGKGVITSDHPATLHIRGSYVLANSNGGYPATVSNRVVFAGAAGLSMERSDSVAYPLVLLSKSDSTGELRVSSNRLILAKGCSWPNCSKVSIEGGEFVVEASDNLGAGVTMSIAGDSGKLTLGKGVSLQVARLLIDGVAMRPGYYGSSGSCADRRDDTRFAGAGMLCVGESPGFSIILR